MARRIIQACDDQIAIGTTRYKSMPRFPLEIELMESLQMDLFAMTTNDDGRDKTEIALCLKTRP